MAAMDFIIGETVVGKVLNYKKKHTAQKVISTALDGTVYSQQTGNAHVRYEMDVYCSTSTNRNSIDSANDQCYPVQFIQRNGLQAVTGIIEEDTIDWKEWKDGHGVGHFTIIKETA